ncbi:class II fructose-bisphosphate aldolase [Micromonospora sp. NPDC005413]|uniref:class II fructose-bisphosphate aldolase n=1 Tax=Micromonospora sp. NPDC005413 TaxID=3154563 RepID=UPI0033B1E28C
MDLQLQLREGPAIPAFNFNDQFDLAAVVDALEARGRPGILMISTTAIAFGGLEFLFEIFNFHRRRTSQHLFIQLDHCADEATMLQAAELKFDLVMADYSHLAVEDNIAWVARLTALLRGSRCLVEAAPTPIPDTAAGREDRSALTSPGYLRQYVAETGCQVVAPHLGTLHGFGRDKPPVDHARVQKLARSSPVPVAVHGCDFLAPGQLATLAGAGVRKLNVGPQLRVAWCTAARRAWEDCDLREPDQRRVHRTAGGAVRAEVEKILDALA